MLPCACGSWFNPLVLECLKAVEESAAPTPHQSPNVGPEPNIALSRALSRAGLLRAAPRLAAWRRLWVRRRSAVGTKALCQSLSAHIARGIDARDLETCLLTPARRRLVHASFARLDGGGRSMLLQEAMRTAAGFDVIAVLLRCGGATAGFGKRQRRRRRTSSLARACG